MWGGALDLKEGFGLGFCFNLGQPVKGRPSDSEIRTSVPGHSRGAGFLWLNQVLMTVQLVGPGKLPFVREILWCCLIILHVISYSLGGFLPFLWSLCPQRHPSLSRGAFLWFRPWGRKPTEWYKKLPRMESKGHLMQKITCNYSFYWDICTPGSFFSIELMFPVKTGKYVISNSLIS